MRVVHWAVAADEAVAGRVAPANPAVAARAMAMRVNVLIARSFQSVLRLGDRCGVGASRGVCVCDAAVTCELGLHDCQVNHFVVTSRKIVKNCISK